MVQTWINVVAGPNMQAMFENTGLQDLKLDDIDMPYDAIYVALPGFDGKLFDFDSGYHDIRGVFNENAPKSKKQREQYTQ